MLRDQMTFRIWRHQPSDHFRVCRSVRLRAALPLRCPTPRARPVLSFSPGTGTAAAAPSTAAAVPETAEVAQTCTNTASKCYSLASCIAAHQLYASMLARSHFNGSSRAASDVLLLADIQSKTHKSTCQTAADSVGAPSYPRPVPLPAGSIEQRSDRPFA